MQIKEATQLFYFGLRGKRSYFSFGIHQVFETRFNYPGQLVGWAIRGPGDAHYAGKSLDLGNFYGRSIAYNKVSVNYARDVTSKLRLGARFNYLLGVASGESQAISGSLTISTDSVSIRTGNINMQTAGIDFFDQDNLSTRDYAEYFLKTKNKGMSLDFGATYDVTDNIMISAAVSDIGYISWKEYTRSYQVNPVNYTFRGFDLLDYINQNGNQSIDNEIDSLESLYNATETTGNTFKTSLIGKFYAGVNLKVLRINNFSALLYLDLFKNKISPAVSLGYNLQLGRLLNTTVGITYQNGNITNIGAGIALKLTHLQFYATSDRANSFVYPSRASRGDAHIGMNLVFGKTKKKETVDKKEEEKKEEVKPETVQEAIEEEVKPDSVIEVPKNNEPLPDTLGTQMQAGIQPKPVETPPSPPILKDDGAPAPVVKVPAQPKHEVVKKGTHPEELQIAHYVIVGVYRSRENAQRYSQMLLGEGHENNFGFVTARNVYYVYVHSSGDLEETRNMRDQYRTMPGFQFPDSWVLTVEE